MDHISIRTLSDGLNELISVHGLSDHVEGLDWSKILYSAVNRLVKWTYDDDIRYDILLGALMYKVFRHSDHFFRNFIENSDGRSLKLYLTSVIYRAVMDESIRVRRDLDRFVDLPVGMDAGLMDKIVSGVTEDFVDERLEYENVLHKLVQRLRCASLSEVLLKTLSLRLRGFSPVEISRYMCVSVSSVRGWCVFLQEQLVAVAEMEDNLGNGYLKGLVDSYRLGLAVSTGSKICGEHQQLSDINLVLSCDTAWAEDRVVFGLN